MPGVNLRLERIYFNPRPPAEGDVRRTPKSYNIPPFQSTPSRGGRRNTLVINRALSYFNPRPPAEGDVTLRLFIVVICPISIHALPRRATVNGKYEQPSAKISIHALPRRATWRFELTF